MIISSLSLYKWVINLLPEYTINLLHEYTRLAVFVNVCMHVFIHRGTSTIHENEQVQLKTL